MKNTLLLLIAIIAFCFPSSATTYTITVANFSFSPAAITTVHVGDTVKWVWTNGSHTTTSLGIPSGAAAWNAPLNSSNTTFIYVPTVLGTYNYECTPHSPNMAGSFAVVSGTGGPTLPHGIVRNIKVEDYEFKPSSLTVNLGDTIRWFWDEGSHTTTSNTIPSGATAWNAPINSSSPSFLYVPTMPGNYTYKCLPHAAMGMTGTFTVTGTIPSTAIGTIAGNVSFSLFPNPAEDFIKLDLLAVSGDVHVLIVDATGRQAESLQVAGGKEATLSIAHLPAGAYMLHVAGKDFKTSQQFIVVH